MNEHFENERVDVAVDVAVDRLLREYQEDLRAQSPRADVLARLRAENRSVHGSSPVVAIPLRPARGWASGWRWSGMAVAASLLVALVVYRSGSHSEAAVQVTLELAPVPAAVSGDAATPAVANAVAPRAAAKKVTIDPSAPPSIQAAMRSGVPEDAVKEKEARGRRLAEAAAEAPAESRARSESVTAEAKAVSTAGTAPAVSTAGARASASAASPALASPALASGAMPRSAAAAAPGRGPAMEAKVLREVWEPNQLARVFEGTYQRMADGTEVRSPLAPAEMIALSQNSQSVMRAPALPSQQSIPLPREQQRGLSSVRDQIADARAKTALTSTSLGEGVVEGFRCVGTRTLDGQRVIERWHSAELGLDLLVRTTEANGAQVVLRYVNIERR